MPLPDMVAKIAMKATHGKFYEKIKSFYFIVDDSTIPIMQDLPIWHQHVGNMGRSWHARNIWKSGWNYDVRNGWI
jgi:hypothetical protein